MSDLPTMKKSSFPYRRVSVITFLLVYVVATLGLAHTSNYDQGLLLVAVVFSILALSLDLVAGVLGLYSLGHAGLLAIGAYGTTILVNNYHWNVFEALLAVVAADAVMGIIIGGLALRVSGLYFAITTYIFTLIVSVVAADLTITGGYAGLSGPSFPNFPSAISSLGTSLVWVLSGAFFITVLIIWSIRRSAAYPVLLAIRDAEPFAASAGVRTSRTRVQMFGLSAALAGLAGWGFCFLGFINPGQFNGTATINVLVMVIIGGINTILGPIIGASFISLFPVVVSWNPLWQEILFGVIFVFVVVVIPEGFTGLVSRLARRLQSRFSTSTTPSASTALIPPDIRSEPPINSESSNSSEFALEARNINFSYLAGVKVLIDVDFVARRGTIHGLIGPNGSGKSTLVNLLAGELKPTSGTISLNGNRVENLKAPARPGYGLMRTFQTPVMVRDVTTQDNVTIGLFHRYRRIPERSLLWPLLPSGRRDGRAIKTAAHGALRNVGLGEEWVKVRVADSPHGVEQLTQLAAACVGEPSILILDEPLTGLSAGEVKHVADILRSLRSQGVTVIVVEHQTRFIFDVCDEVTVLAAGQFVRSGTASEVRADDRVREVYLGQ